MLLAAGDPESWASMSADGWIKAVGGLLLMLMVYLLKRFLDNNIKIMSDMKAEGEADRKLIREECALVRADHRQDMTALFTDAKEDRKVTQDGFHELSQVIRELKNEIHNRSMPS